MKNPLLRVSLASLALLALVGATVADQSTNFVAHLAGENEVPAVATKATGQAVFMFDEDAGSLHYKLVVANIDDVMQAHIHAAPAGTNGAVVAFLYGPGPAQSQSGVLAEGTIMADDLVGPLAGQPLSALIDLMRADGAYVNVHTMANPGGEIRGQIR